MRAAPTRSKHTILVGLGFLATSDVLLRPAAPIWNVIEQFIQSGLRMEPVFTISPYKYVRTVHRWLGNKADKIFADIDYIAPELFLRFIPPTGRAIPNWIVIGLNFVARAKQ